MMARRRSRFRPSPTRPPPSRRNQPASFASAPVSNLLLAALPRHEYDRIVPTLETVLPKLKDTLHAAGEPIQHVFFPGSGGFFSVLTVLEDGNRVEVATIGREGMVGVSAVLDGAPFPAEAMVQVEMDTVYRMTAAAFRGEMDRRGAFYQLLTHYSQALVGVVMQATACNAVHSVEQRLARWLLLAHDRVGKDQFPLTQEFVAMMLGATRPTVTVVAGALQRAGLITYHRGHIAIVDREALENASCECYLASTRMLRVVTATRVA